MVENYIVSDSLKKGFKSRANPIARSYDENFQKRSNLWNSDDKSELNGYKYSP
jgi:hypothetical protein